MADSSNQKKPRGRPRKKSHDITTAVQTSKSLKDPKTIQLTKTQKQEYLKQKITQLYTLDYDSIVAKFAPVVESVKNGGTMKQAAFAGGLSPEELRLLLDYGRFGGSPHWQAFFEEFYRAKSAHDISVMKHLRECAQMGEKWAIQRLMNIMDPEEFGSFDVESTLPARPHLAGVEVVLNIKDKFSESDILDAEIVDASN